MQNGDEASPSIILAGQALKVTSINGVSSSKYASFCQKSPISFEPHIPSGTRNWLLAHLSRRLIGELIVYQWSGVRRRPSSSSSVVVRRPFTYSNIFFSKTAWPIKAKSYVKPPWEGGTKVYINDPGHMTKMAAMLKNAQNLKKSSSPEPLGQLPWILVCSIRICSTTNFI